MTPEQIKIYQDLIARLPVGDPYRPTFTGEFPPTFRELRDMAAPIEVLTIEARGRAASTDAEDRARYGKAGANWFNEGPAAVAPAAAGLPAEARAMAGLPMENPPVHRAQIKPIPGDVDKEGFLARVRNLPVWPKLSNKTRMAVGRALVWAIGKEVRGIAMISYSGLATAAQCCRTQAWRAIRCFRAHGILDVFNVIVREDNELFREPNAYSLRGFTKAIPAVVDAVKDMATGAFDRAKEQVRRFAHVWDMRANCGPRRGPSKPRTNPAPA